MRFLLFLCSLALTSSFAPADPTEDIVRTKTPFRNFSLSQVSKGEILENRQGVSIVPDVQAIQTCFIVKAPVAAVTSTLLHWNPAGKPGLDVSSHRVLTPPVSAASFKPTLGPFFTTTKGGGWIVKESKAAKGSELLLTEAEKTQLGAATTPETLLTAWSNLLVSRFQSFQGHGAADFSSLLAAMSKIGPLDVAAPAHGTYYWELSDLTGRGSISEGVTWQDGTRVCDGEFFVTSEYSASFDVSTLWPVTVDGKPATLVWRIDSAKSPQFASLKGAERLASGSLILSSTKKAIKAIREQAEK